MASSIVKTASSVTCKKITHHVKLGYNGYCLTINTICTLAVKLNIPQFQVVDNYLHEDMILPTLDGDGLQSISDSISSLPD